MPVILSQRDEMRRNRAIQNSPQNVRKREMQARMDAARRRANEERRREQELFRLWAATDDMVQALEKIRNDNEPKTPDEPWNRLFCAAVEHLPMIRERAKELWYEYTEIKGGDE